VGRNRSKAKGRSDCARYVGIPQIVWTHPDFAGLSPRATKLLIDVAGQYNGYNNGDLCMAMTIMRKRGWKSCSNLRKARKELLDTGMILQTAQGGRNLPSLYALTWQSIDECKGKLDVPHTKSPPRSFIQSKSAGPLVDQFKPQVVRGGGKTASIDDLTAPSMDQSATKIGLG
jgi:hypothetical protein